MIGSLVSVLHVDPGFRADHVLTMHFSMPPSRYAKNEQFAELLSAGAGAHLRIAGGEVGQLLRRAAHDAHSHDEVHS